MVIDLSVVFIVRCPRRSLSVYSSFIVPVVHYLSTRPSLSPSFVVRLRIVRCPHRSLSVYSSFASRNNNFLPFLFNLTRFFFSIKNKEAYKAVFVHLLNQNHRKEKRKIADQNETRPYNHEAIARDGWTGRTDVRMERQKFSHVL